MASLNLIVALLLAGTVLAQPQAPKRTIYVTNYERATNRFINECYVYDIHGWEMRCPNWMGPGRHIQKLGYTRVTGDGNLEFVETTKIPFQDTEIKWIHTIAFFPNPAQLRDY